MSYTATTPCVPAFAAQALARAFVAAVKCEFVVHARIMSLAHEPAAFNLAKVPLLACLARPRLGILWRPSRSWRPGCRSRPGRSGTQGRPCSGTSRRPPTWPPALGLRRRGSFLGFRLVWLTCGEHGPGAGHAVQRSGHGDGDAGGVAHSVAPIDAAHRSIAVRSAPVIADGAHTMAHTSRRSTVGCPSTNADVVADVNPETVPVLV